MSLIFPFNTFSKAGFEISSIFKNRKSNYALSGITVGNVVDLGVDFMVDRVIMKKRNMAAKFVFGGVMKKIFKTIIHKKTDNVEVAVKD